MGRALISVSDKTGILEFSKQLFELGYEIVSTGGTADVISKAGIPVINVSDVTGFSECLGGRVKTLHPNIHAGILAMRGDSDHMQTLSELDIAPIDIVCINLYPFVETIQKPKIPFDVCVENIDIGGPTMLRAAAKNFQDVICLVSPDDYQSVVDDLKEHGEVSRERRLELAYKVFLYTSLYDTEIARYFRVKTGQDPFPPTLTLSFEKQFDMRYGENPHQRAAFYKDPLYVKGSAANAKQLHGKELSFNNINDINGALELIKEFGSLPAVVAVKHTTPCGVAVGEDICQAYTAAYDCDPVSIFGGIIAANRQVDRQTAEKIASIFIEVVIAQSFSQEALEVLTAKKNIRLLELADIADKSVEMDVKKVTGGLLVQEMDEPAMLELKCVTNRQPTGQELEAMRFGWKVVKHTKSNAIVLSLQDRTVGIGGGQTNRVGALQIAISNAGDSSKGSVMASDAYFPFSDCVELAHKAGVTAIIQPGGSIRDQESIDLCDQYGISMVFTGIRHFKH